MFVSPYPEYALCVCNMQKTSSNLNTLMQTGVTLSNAKRIMKYINYYAHWHFQIQYWT